MNTTTSSLMIKPGKISEHVKSLPRKMKSHRRQASTREHLNRRQRLGGSPMSTALQPLLSFMPQTPMMSPRSRDQTLVEEAPNQNRHSPQ
jgi:hypothetical protein